MIALQHPLLTELRQVLPAVLRLSLFCGLSYILYKFSETIVFTYRTHTRYGDIPHLPRRWILGHLANVGPTLDPSINQHPDYAFEDVWLKLGKPPLYFLDLAPIDRCMIIIADPSIAEAITQPSERFKYSTPVSLSLSSRLRVVTYHCSGCADDLEIEHTSSTY